MNAHSRVFPYDKSIMLSVLYDTLDALGFRIERANSVRGTVIAVSGKPDNRRMRIACNSIPPRGDTEMEIFPEHAEDIDERLSGMLMDEIIATARRSLERSGKQIFERSVNDKLY